MTNDFIDLITPLELEILRRFDFYKAYEKNNIDDTKFIKLLMGNAKELIKQGFRAQAIEVIVKVIQGRHPKSGMIKTVLDEFHKREVGWKLHLNILIQNHNHVWNWLNINCPYTCKYRMGGEEGKDFTIYIGPYDEAQNFALRLEKSSLELEQIHPDTLSSDMPITQRIAGSFSFDKYQQSNYTRYGWYGVPFCNEDKKNYIAILPLTKLDASKERILKELIKKAYLKLQQEYGTYFTGTKQQVAHSILKRFGKEVS